MGNRTHAQTTTRRGYGARHQTLRKRWAQTVAGGNVRCARCGELISPDEHWDLGHAVDGDKSKGYAGPEHRRCNRGGHRRTIDPATGEVTDTANPTHSRDWGTPLATQTRRYSREW